MLISWEMQSLQPVPEADPVIHPEHLTAEIAPAGEQSQQKCSCFSGVTQQCFRAFSFRAVVGFVS